MKSIFKFFVFLIIISCMCISEVCAQKVKESILSDNRYRDGYTKVCFPDASTGIVVGANYADDGIHNSSLIMRTEDAGGSWNPQTHPITNSEDPKFMDICFSDPMNGWVVGLSSKILNTKDGGKTWTQKGGPPWGIFESVFCIDSITVWVGEGSGSNATFYHTTDGGKTWTAHKTELKTYIWDILFINADTGIAVGGQCGNCGGPEEHGFILRTTDGGENWNLQENDTNIMGYYEIFFTNDTIGYVVGAGGTIKQTIDGGQTWTKQTSGTTTDLWGIYFVNADTGFVDGINLKTWYDGIMLHTTDGGTTWTKQDIPSSKGLSDVYFTDENTGTAVGAWGYIISTTTGGESWSEYIWPVNSIISNEILTEQNFPNPFSRYTTIRYEVPEAGNVTLKIYTLDGKIIATLVDEEMRPGTYEVTWDAGDLTAGVYFCRIEAGSTTESRKLVLQR
jgi:photosystem II stability/assembly factor-like uncharacterized protein